MVKPLLPRSSGGVCVRSPVISLSLIVIFVALSFSAGCASIKERGDRAFAAKEYNVALDHYEQEMEQGSRDADMYYKAAQAAVRVGDFSLAERYYSRSLRYGGGEDVKRSLAQFYIATSNYAKAVRVLQQLLETTDEPQSIFNNLGTALMYAGAPLDAESYLLVAQQMNPDDPVPYINLGVLYDKYLHQPQMALGFYQCFLTMSNGGSNRRHFEARAKNIELSYGKDLPERYNVECGEAYQPPGPPSKEEVRATLKPEKPAERQPDEAESGEKTLTGKGENAREDYPEQPGQAGDDEPLKIYRQVDKLPEQPTSSMGGAEKSTEAKTLALAEQAFSQQNHARVVKYLEGMPAAALDARAMSLYGRSLAELGELQRAQRWLAASVEEDRDAETVAVLIAVYRRLDAADKLNALCEHLANDGTLEETLEACPE